VQVKNELGLEAAKPNVGQCLEMVELAIREFAESLGLRRASEKASQLTRIEQARLALATLGAVEDERKNRGFAFSQALRRFARDPRQLERAPMQRGLEERLAVRRQLRPPQRQASSLNRDRDGAPFDHLVVPVQNWDCADDD
jgi:hypothetical protein